ncbi:hypothetical protein KSS87_004532 [Heliosperma pusillum]|nr:hypothetical protein KSS87_004532 [Heliosperma pusillum]
MPTSSKLFHTTKTLYTLRPYLTAAIGSHHTNYFVRLAHHRYYSIYIASLLSGVQILPLFAVPGSFDGSVKSIVTQSYSDKADAADEIVEQVISTIESTSSNKEICNEIGRLCKSESVSAITKLLQHLHNKQVVLSFNALDILLSATSKQNDIELSLQVFQDLLVFSDCLSSKSYGNLARAFANTDDCELLLKFVRDISDGTLHHKVLILNRIIYGFAEARQIEKALTIYGYMKDSTCKPDLITYNTIIWILGRAGKLDDMLLEFASMKEADVVPDIVTYNTLLNKLIKFGRIDLCVVYMREVDEKGLILDLRTYTALIESFGRSGQTDQAMKLFDSMKHRNVRPSIYIYRSLINNLKKMGKLKAAASLFSEMNDSLPNLIGPKDFKRKNRRNIRFNSHR